MLRTIRILIALLALSICVRLFTAYLVGETPLVGDEWDYYRRAKRALALKPGDGFRAPLFEWVLAGLMGVFGRSSDTLRIAIAGLSSLVVVPVFLAGRALVNVRTGMIAGALASVYPPLVAYSHYLWTEALYTAGAAATLVLTTYVLTRRDVWASVWAGVCWAALMLTREVALAAFATVLIWAAWQRGRPRWRRNLAIVAFAAAIPVGLWSVVLNAERKEGEAIALIARTSYLNLYIGNGPVAAVKASKPKLSARRHYESLPGPAARREALARPLVLQSIREAGPNWLPRKIAQMVPKFFRPGGFPVRRLLIAEDKPRSPWAYRGQKRRPLQPELARWLASVYVAAVAAVLVVGTAGWSAIGALHAGPLYWAFTTFALGHLWPTVVAFATTRFRLPIMPMFLLGAAYLATSPRTVWSQLSNRGRAAFLASGALMAWLVLSQYDRALTAAWQ